MRKRLPLILFTLFIAVAVKAQTSNDVEQWQRYTVEGAGFSVKLPTRPVLTALQVSYGPPRGKRWERTLLATADGVQYTVRAYENPAPQQSLTDFVTLQSLPQRSKLVAKRSFKKDGVDRHEYTWLDKNKKPRTEQFFATEQHIYHFLVEGADADHPGAKQFFSSILLGSNPEGIAISDGPGLNGEKIYERKEVDQKVRITKFFPPEYTEEARRNKVTGTVILKVVLSSNGQITNISVVSGLPFGLTERAIAAARKMQFVPAVKDGKNVSMWTQLEYNFDLY